MERRYCETFPKNAECDHNANEKKQDYDTGLDKRNELRRHRM